MSYNKKAFASDNYAGIHHNILSAIENANSGHARSYGEDYYTQEALLKIKEHFGENAEAFFVFNGTAANVLAIQSVVKSYHAVICASSAHINVDECGAPENFTGCKLYAIPAVDGKLTIDSISPYVLGYGDPENSHDQHRNQSKAILISQSTEMGTLYSVEEIKAITGFAKKHDMRVIMDGARLSNAAAALGLSVKQLTADAGIDVVTFGGTKNGMMIGEAVVFFNKDLAKDFRYIRKQGMQLASKMRFISAQFLAYLNENLYLKNAIHANKMAKLLYNELQKIHQVKISRKVEVNAVFAILEKKQIALLQQQYFFYMWDETKNEVRWMTSFDTTEEDIKEFVKAIADVVKE